MEEGASSSSQCLVCSAPISSVHLGMDICRACSCFFKRTKSLGRQYACRLGDRKCTVAKDGKFACRSCRMDRCILVGLAYEGPLRVRKKTLPILERIKAEASACIEKRRMQELELIIRHGGHKRHPYSECFGMELYEMHPATIMEIYRISIVEGYEFFRNVFPSFSQVSDRDQQLIFKDYVGKVSLLEGYHRSRQIWDGINRNMMCSVTTYCDLSMEEKSGDGSSIVSFAKSIAEEQNAVFLSIYNKCSITENEYYALLALLMFELDTSCEISEESQDILDQYRSEVLYALQCYYRYEMGLNDYSTRLGNLMSLNHAIQECKSLFKVFFSFYTTIFDVFMTNTLLKDFFL
ncbi:hypothetical protein PMAYCL1PPCAC_15494 [Pristionchus mayeri]|uniref:Nuclear receptor n=1 Tax=Pristionchus mayeri TaxID=1317129 RepID=A0AAN5HY77_9BILA|nr:hypothetical protein PMAYCL1PPCAC_15494 [Pristionchus mayeri]